MKNNKLFLSALALAIATPGVVQTIEVEAATTSFKDIYSTNPHKAKIDTLVAKGVIAGYEDGTFQPYTKVNRGQFALFIARALALPMPSTPKSFKDVGTSASVYEGVVKAQAAGIIQGYPDGRFKAGELISRGDMAIMLDRALQYKGSYTTKATLSYSDKGSIGSSAYEAVQRLINYKIMSAYSGTSFSAKVQGDRLSTVVSIYQLMDTKNLLTGGEVINPTPTPPPTSTPSEIDIIKAKDPRDLTLSEVEKAWGTYRIVERIDQWATKRGFVERNLWGQYIDDIDFIEWEENNLTPPKPDEWLKYELSDEGFLKGLMNETRGNYPNYEVISVNGKPFYTSELMDSSIAQYNYDEFVKGNGSLLPYPPSESGQFIVDIHFSKTDFATYRKDSVGLAEQTVLPYMKNGVLYADIARVFEDVNEVTITNTSAAYNGQSINYSDLSSLVETKSGRLMVPIREVAQKIGLHTRTATEKVEKIEIRNYVPTSDRAWN